ncbi:MAG: hypothetical protein HQM02_06140 [Magnetococcales bacterium]|nr:hypothetical protein [Magnetococcales bacterium]
MYQYRQQFLDYASLANRATAREIASLLRGSLSIESVVDFGCARGAWLAEWQSLGVADILGLDGDYVDPNGLLIPPQRFLARDLHHPIRLNRRFDLVQCLEVAEHIVAERAPVFIGNLVAHGQIILFSAAPPGQGGDHHVNEQPYEYWRDLFLRHRFELFDCIRPLIADNPVVNRWYRYNVMLYVHPDAVSRLPQAWLHHRVGHRDPIEDISPMVYQIKKGIVRLLPDAVENGLARLVAGWNASRLPRA